MSEFTTLFNPDRALQVLRAQRLDALIAVTHEDWLYLTDCDVRAAATIGSPTAAILIQQPCRVAAIVVPRAAAGEVAEFSAQIERVILYGQLHAARTSDAELDQVERATVGLLEDEASNARDFTDGIALALQGLGLDHATVGVDDPETAQRLAGRLSGVTCVSGSSAFEWLRRVKTNPEIERLQAAAALAEEVEQLAIEFARPGAIWSDYLRDLPIEVAKRGAVLGFWGGGAGRRSGFLLPAGEDPLTQGDLLRIDLTIVHRGYWADTGRSASIGPASPKAARRYAAIERGVEAALDSVRPGVTFAQIYEAGMRAVAGSMPELRRHHCGHSIGLRPYDGLLVEPGTHVPLEVGMTLNIEMPYYEIGWGGLQLEETIVVTNDGYALLTHMPRGIAVAG